MRLLQHLDLPMVHLAVVHVFLGEPQQYPGLMHVVVHGLLADVGSDDAVVERRIRVPVLQQVALHSAQLCISEQVSARQAGAVEQHWLFQLAYVLLAEGALHEGGSLLPELLGEGVQEGLHVYF